MEPILLLLMILSGKSLQEYLKKTFEELGKLRELLTNYTSFGNYADFDVDVGAEDRYAKMIIDMLPIVHGELSYLSFQTSSWCAGRGGFKWPVKYICSDCTGDFNKWLTDQTAKGAGIIKRGFGTTTLKKVENVNSEIPMGINITQGGALNYAQFGLLFVGSTWQHSNLANAVLFLQEFCKDIHGSKFVGQFEKGTPVFNRDVLRNLCFNLSTHLNNMSRGILPLFEHLKRVEGSDETVSLESK